MFNAIQRGTERRFARKENSLPETRVRILINQAAWSDRAKDGRAFLRAGRCAKERQK